MLSDCKKPPLWQISSGSVKWSTPCFRAPQWMCSNNNEEERKTGWNYNVSHMLEDSCVWFVWTQQTIFQQKRGKHNWIKCVFLSKEVPFCTSHPSQLWINNSKKYKSSSDKSLPHKFNYITWLLMSQKSSLQSSLKSSIVVWAHFWERWLRQVKWQETETKSL